MFFWLKKLHIPYSNDDVDEIFGEKSSLNLQEFLKLVLPEEEKLSLFKENQTLIGSLNAFLN